jgi:DnaK suppressor protein
MGFKKLPIKVVRTCNEKLLAQKEEVLNKLKTNGRPPDIEEKMGDAGDQNVRAMHEHEWLSFQNRLRAQLLEVESALSRIESGIFGVCEETELPIETNRLLAIPWTRLSIEGAKLRESLQR